MAAAPGEIRYIIYINYGDTVPSFKLTFGEGIIITESSQVTPNSEYVVVGIPSTDKNYWTIQIDISDSIAPVYILEATGYVTEEGTMEGATNNTKSFTLKPSKLYAYEIDGYSGNYGYLASLPPIVNKSLLYDSNGTFGSSVDLDATAYMYGERLTAVSGDQITVLSYIEPT